MKTLIFSLLFAAAIVACSENPLDPDKVGQVKTGFDELIAQSCDLVCARIADCGCVVPSSCVAECNASLSEEERIAFLQVPCQQVRFAFCP